MRAVESLPTAEGGGAAASAVSPLVLDWLCRPPEPPEAIDRSDWEYAVRYARGRFERGVEHYGRLFEQLGWSGMQHGLDAGAGAGHWTIAFALDNRRASGIDRNAAFVELANGAAAASGVAERVRHQVGDVEAVPFPAASFDAAWSHSTLQFCDAEKFVREMSRVLQPGGRFYCGWSTTGFRLSAIYQRALGSDLRQLQAHVESYLASVLHHDGMERTPWPGPPIVTAPQLAQICAAFGLDFDDQPGLQDDAPAFAGVPQTIDISCIRNRKAEPLRADLREVSPADPEGRERLYELVRLGLGRLVYEALTERRDFLGDPAIRSIHALAGLRAGQVQQAARLADEQADPLVRGLLALEQNRVGDAVVCFRELPAGHRDRSFLLGVAMLLSGAADAAVGEFETGLGEGRRPVECGLAALLARSHAADWPELRRRMAQVLHILPRAMDGAAADASVLADRLLRVDG